MLSVYDMYRVAARPLGRQVRACSQARPRLAKNAPPGSLPALVTHRDLQDLLGGRFFGKGKQYMKLLRATAEQVDELRHAMGTSGLVPYVVAADLLMAHKGVACRYYEGDVAEVKAPGLQAAKGRRLVATLLGHVDHGKTTLLSTWSGKDLTAGEHGGITQGVRAISVALPGDRALTVLDTPGHKLFKLFREHGSFTCDVVVLVVDVSEGVKRQTLESMRLAQKHDRPLVIAAAKVDAVPPADLKPRLKALKVKLEKSLRATITFNFRQYLDDCAAAARPGAASTHPGRRGVVPAVPVSGLHQLQTSELLEVVHEAASCSVEHEGHAPPQAPSPLEAESAAVVLDVVANQRAVQMEAGHSEAQRAMYDPLTTRKQLQRLDGGASLTSASGRYTSSASQEWGLLCLLKRGAFRVGAPSHWLAGRSTWGETGDVTDEFGRPFPSGGVVSPGTPFILTRVLGGPLPDPGAHVLSIEGREKAHAVLAHREAISDYLNGGGDAALLTPAREADAYQWLLPKDDDAAAEEEIDVNELEQRGLLCPAWVRTGECHDPGCRLAHPVEIAVEPPTVVPLVICADTQGSLRVVEDVIPLLNDAAVKVSSLCDEERVVCGLSRTRHTENSHTHQQFRVIRSQLGAPDVNTVVFAGSGGEGGGGFAVPLLCYKAALPRHMVPIAVTQQVEVFELSVLAEVVRTLDGLACAKYDDWLTRQTRRWDRFETPAGKRVVAKRKRAKVVEQILSEDYGHQQLVDIYSTE